jgi:hypothetical protein
MPVDTHTGSAPIAFFSEFERRPTNEVHRTVLGIPIGCAAAGGYAYPLLQEARQRVTAAEGSRDALGKTVKEQEEQLKGL